MSFSAAGRRGGGFRNFGGGGGGRGRGGGRGGGGRGRFQGNNSNRGGPGRRQGRGGGGRGPLQYDPSKFDPIEEIGVISGDNTSAADIGIVRIAVEGCCHGELDVIYQRLQDHERTSGHKIDLLLCCGDFQSHRNAADFLSSSIPPKYRSLGTFPKYFAAEQVAPILTVFIGGNHEASQPLRELYYGGWVAPNIYYMGAAGVIQFAGLRIGGISGIYKSHDYEFGHYESVPYDHSSLRSVYHVRNVDVLRMKCLSLGRHQMDVIMSHDWPLGIEQHGDLDRLLRQKPYFREEIQRNDLGSPPNREILDAVKPKRWFSAHLHVKFQAVVKHGASEGKQDGDDNDYMPLIPSQVTNQTAEVDGKQPKAAEEEDTQVTAENKEGSDVVASTTEFHSLESSKCRNDSVNDLTEQMTRFLALDKCLPRRQFLSVLNLPAAKPSEKPYRLEYDPEWLAIVKKTHHMNVAERRRVQVPRALNEILTSEQLAEETEWVVNRLQSRIDTDSETTSSFPIPKHFVATVPFYTDPVFQDTRTNRPLPQAGNPITDDLLQLLELDHIVTCPYDSEMTPKQIAIQLGGSSAERPLPSPLAPVVDSNEIDIDLDDDAGVDVDADAADAAPTVSDDNKIDLDSDGDDIVEEDHDPDAANKKARLDE